MLHQERHRAREQCQTRTIKVGTALGASRHGTLLDQEVALRAIGHRPILLVDSIGDRTGAGPATVRGCLIDKDIDIELLQGLGQGTFVWGLGVRGGPDPVRHGVKGVGRMGVPIDTGVHF